MHRIQSFHVGHVLFVWFLVVVMAGTENLTYAQEMIFPVESRSAQEMKTFTCRLLGNKPLERPAIDGSYEFIPEGYSGNPAFAVRVNQYGMKIDEPVFITPATTIEWAWRKPEGKVCIIQLGIVNPSNNEFRYFGYGAGVWSDPPNSADPTVEVFVDDQIPRQWTRVTRNLYQDIVKVLGWKTAQINNFYLSPFDGQQGFFADSVLIQVTDRQKKNHQLRQYMEVGQGSYLPLPLKDYDDQRVEVFETSFEECAPGRNSAANEWSAFGVMGDMNFNCMGRDLRVRYPAFDLVFRLQKNGQKIKPDTLDSFRLGLVGNRYPAIWAGWRDNELLYKVSVMTVPDNQRGGYDLYKVEIQNPTGSPIKSSLFAGVDGSPDMKLENGVVRGLGEAPFVIASEAVATELMLRDWGLCDKRAKAYHGGGTPGKTGPEFDKYRLGLDGLPVKYRVKVEPKKKYLVYLGATQHIDGYYLEKPQNPGDLIFEYAVEGAPSQKLDYIEYIRKNNSPIMVGFAGCHDTDSDGYLEMIAGVDSSSPIKHTRLSAIYVFPAETQVENMEAVYSGRMNTQCLYCINVGVTPEQWWNNQYYDKTDIGLAQLKINYNETIAPGEIKTYWLKVPPIHRREPVSMGYIAHTFRDILPGEAMPEYSQNQVTNLKNADPQAAEKMVYNYWDRFFAGVATFALPDKVLNDIFLSRLATRAILDIKISEGVYYNACTPFFYFDHAYRDLAYVIYAYDLAGLHDRAARLLDVFCMDVEDVKVKGPISFDGQPLQLGMMKDGRWKTRPGQHDTQGQNIWALVQHYKLTGDRSWLKNTSYPYIRRAAMWIVDSRHRHMQEVKDPQDLRYGLIEPGAMEVMEVGKGMHMYYLNTFAVLGLREAADAAATLGQDDDHELFRRECRDLKQSLHKSFTGTFKRNELYRGHLWFGVEPEGIGMYGFWAHNCMLWPCRAIEPHDPMLTATFRHMEMMAENWGGGLHSEGKGGFWPYIGVDRAIGYILRGEPEKTLDYFCAFTDTAGGTFSWGEGYNGVISAGDQPHFWADGQWINIFRQLFVFEDDDQLLLTPALFRRWHKDNQIELTGLPTHFGSLNFKIASNTEGTEINYTFQLTPQGDQKNRTLNKILLYPRTSTGTPLETVKINGRSHESFTSEVIIIKNPQRNKKYRITVKTK